MDKELFKQAVIITAAFIANGDIRVGSNMGANSEAMGKTYDLLLSTYKVLKDAQSGVDA